MITPYQLEFHMLAADSGCNTLALIDTFMNGLSEPIQDHLALFELPQDLQNIIAMSIRVDNFKRQRKSSIGLQFLLLVVGGTLWESHLRGLLRSLCQPAPERKATTCIRGAG